MLPRIIFSIIACLFLAAKADSGSMASDRIAMETTSDFANLCGTIDTTPQTMIESFKTGYCVGWIAGLTDGIHEAEDLHSIVESAQVFCPPVGNSYQQMIHIIRKYITDHPEKEHLPINDVAGLALHRAFPCMHK